MFNTFTEVTNLLLVTGDSRLYKIHVEKWLIVVYWQLDIKESEKLNFCCDNENFKKASHNAVN